MGSLRESIMEHMMNNKQSLNPTQISNIQDRLTQILSQFHTPDHPPYAAMIQRALQELNQKGGSTEKSISEFIKREYDDLPWAHCSLLKHHLGLLSKDGEIILTRGFRYSLRGAGSSLGLMKGGKKHRKKKGKWKFERLRTKRLKLAIAVRSEKEKEFEVIKDPSPVNDQSSQVAGNLVIETKKGRNDGLQSPIQDGTMLLQLPDGGENDICSGSKDMDIDPPLVLTGGREKQVGTEQQLQQENCHDPCYQHHVRNSKEDACHELSSPERPPGFEFMGVRESNSQECLLVNSPPLHKSELAAPTISHLPSDKKEQHRNAPPTPIAEKLKKDDLAHPLQQMHAKKKGRHPEGRQFEKVLEQNEIVLALPYLQKGSPPSNGSPLQNERSRRQLRRWSEKLPNMSHTVKALCSSENSGKCTPVEITSDLEKSQPSKYTIITRRRAKFSSLPRQSAKPLLVSASFRSSSDLRQDEGCNSQGACHSTHPLVALPQQDKDMPPRKYQRRGRRPKAKTNTSLQDETSPADIKKQRAEELPKLLRYHIPQERSLEAAVSKDEVTVLNHKDHSEKEHQLERPKMRRRGRPANRKLVVYKGKEDQSPKTKKLKKSSNRRAQKTQKKC